MSLRQEDLPQLLEQAQKVNDHLRLENDAFQAYLLRVCPQYTANSEEEEEKTKGKKSKSKVKEAVKRPQELTLEQKHSIVNSEIEELKEEIDRAKSSAEKLLDKLKALDEEANIRIAEIKKDQYEFRRDIIGDERSYRTGKSVADKVLRFLEEKMREKDSLIEKLTLKNAALKSQTTKLESLLQQKEEMGEVYHVIDFDQLKIENQQYLEKIEERNNELLRLKLTTGNIVQVLNTSKKKLNNLTSESQWLQKSMEEKVELLHKIKDDLVLLELEQNKGERLNHKLSSQLKESRTPHVMEYIEQKAQVYELQQAIKTYDRKVEIAEMEEKRWRRLARLSSTNATGSM